MSFDFSSSMNKLTDVYLNSEATGKSTKLHYETAEAAKEKFGDKFAEAYDSLQAMRALDDTMRTSYKNNHKDDIAEKSSAMTFSKGSSRIMDMLQEQLSDDMKEKVNIAMENAINNL